MFRVFRYALKAAMVQHEFPIRGFDLTRNSQFLLSNCSGFALNFFDVDTGALVDDPAKVHARLIERDGGGNSSDSLNYVRDVS